MKMMSTRDLSGEEVICVLSDCEQYRLCLTYRWSKSPALYVWMLNPSKADHVIRDPTVRGLIKRARAWGYGGLVIINLFSFRATQPSDMKAAADPIGLENDLTIMAVLKEAADNGSPVIAGWGRHGSFMDRDRGAKALAKRMGVKLMVLEINDDGSPKHPLYILHEVRPRVWDEA